MDRNLDTSNYILPMNMPLLEIRLFGQLEVLVEGLPPRSFPSRKARWILALLALRCGRKVDRAWLAAKVWPDHDETQARYLLRQCLSNDLRPVLGAAYSCLQSADGDLLLDLVPDAVDVGAFDAGIAVNSPQSLKRAVNLYRGPLLESCNEDWIVDERLQREAAFISALEHLAKEALERQAYGEAIGYLRQLVVVDPLRESAHSALMQVLVLGGDVAAMEQVYRKYRLVLHDELQTAPSAEMESLHQQLRNAALPQIVLLRPFSADAPQKDNLPIPLTTLIGRKKEIDEVNDWLSKGRLVTIRGTGGGGKTRLAIAVARSLTSQFSDGVWFVELQSVTDPMLVVYSMARVLGIAEQPGQDMEQILIAVLGARSLLLILDNCEHLIDACAGLVSRLLAACANLRILVTSRQPLGITGEQQYLVSPLALPPSEISTGAEPLHTTHTPTILLMYSSIQLFVERVRNVSPTFELHFHNARAVNAICHQLDGIPLAIELAAARTSSLSVEEISQRLNNAFALLTVGDSKALRRHETLRALIDWSYDLLTEAEKTLLSHLSVFRGGWLLEAAEAVYDKGRVTEEAFDDVEVLNLLTSLVAKSLVVAETQKEHTRYRLLETIQQYARDRLAEREDGERVRARHQAFFVALAEEAFQHLEALDAPLWLLRLEAEFDNLRLAIQGNDSEARLRMASALSGFWATRGYYDEARKWLTETLANVEATICPIVRAHVLHAAGLMARIQGDYPESRSLSTQSLYLSQQLGDKLGTARSLRNLGHVIMVQGDCATARDTYEQSLTLCQEMGDKRGIANSLMNLGNVAFMQGDYVSARSLFEQGLAIYQEVENRQGIPTCLMNLGNVAVEQGDISGARSLYERSLVIFQELGEKQGIALLFGSLGDIARIQGDYTTVCTLYEQSLAIFQEIGDKQGIARSFRKLGHVASIQRDYAASRSLLEKSLAIFQELASKRDISILLVGFASLASMQEDSARAARLWGAAEALRENLGLSLMRSECDDHTEMVAQARNVIEEEIFASAWAEGRAMTVEQAVEYALGEHACLDSDFSSSPPSLG